MRQGDNLAVIAASSDDGSRPIVLDVATLVDVRSGAQTPDIVLIVRDGRIARVGRRDEVDVPHDGRRIDLRGTWLIPGLVDMHVHLTSHPLHMKLLPLYLAHGVTTVRDVGGHITVLSLLRDEIDARRRTAPRLFFVGPLLDGLPPLWPDITVLVDTVERARTAVRMLAAQNVDGIKVYNNVPERSLAAIAEEAHDAGLPVLGHVPRSLATTRAVELGMDCLEHIRVTGRELLSPEEADRIDPLPIGVRETLLWERFDLRSDGMARLIQRLAESRVYLDPTFLIDAAMFRDEITDGRAVAVEERLPGSARSALHDQEWTDDLRGPADMEERSREGFARRLTFIGMCRDAGVRLLAGTDSFGAGALLPGAGLLNELSFLTQAGLRPLEALQAATLTAACALGREADLGSLEEGKMADIVVLNADPLADIANVRDIRLIVSGGDVHTPNDLVERAAEYCGSSTS